MAKVPQKRCSRCSSVKPTTDFHRCKKAKDGLNSWCKRCNADHRIACYHSNHDHELASRQKWEAENHEKRRASNRASYRRNSHKYTFQSHARSVTRNAIRTGKLIPQPCRVCGKKAEAHHPDYSKPLEIEWLCQQHHKDEHRRLREQRRVAA